MSGLRAADGFGGPLAALLGEAASGAALPAQQQALALRACALLDALGTAAPEWSLGTPFEWLAIVDDEQVTVLQPSGPRILASRRGGRYTALRLMPEAGPEWQLHFLEAALAPAALAEAGLAARPVDEEPMPEVCVSVADGATLVSAYRILPGGEAIDERDSRTLIDSRFREAGRIVRRHAREADSGAVERPERGVAPPGADAGRKARRDWARVAAGAAAAVAGAVSAARPPAPPPLPATGWALVRSGDATGRPFPVAGRVRVGRSPRCEVPLDDPHVSREHAVFEVVDGECVLRDLRSTHGTRVNGQKIETPTRLRDGDRVMIGIAEIVVRGPARPAAATVVSPAPPVCPGCAQPVGPDWTFCSRCGAPLTG